MISMINPKIPLNNSKSKICLFGVTNIVIHRDKSV